MEQGRLFLAIGLSFLVFLAWSLFFASKPPVDKQDTDKPTVPQVVDEKSAAEKPYVKEEADVGSVQTPAVDTKAMRAEVKPARTITVNSPFYIAKISERGAVFNSFVLKDYREFVAKDSPLKELVSEENAAGTPRFGFKNDSVPGLKNAVYVSGVAGDTVVVEDKPVDVTFTWISENDVVIEKKYHFVPNSYLIGLTVTVKNGSAQPILDRPYLALKRFLPPDKRAYGFTGPSALINDSLEQIKIKKIDNNILYDGTIDWIAVQDRYFITSIIPKNAQEGSMRLAHDENHIITQ